MIVKVQYFLLPTRQVIIIYLIRLSYLHALIVPCRFTSTYCKPTLDQFARKVMDRTRNTIDYIFHKHEEASGFGSLYRSACSKQTKNQAKLHSVRICVG